MDYGLKKPSKIAKIGADLGYSATTSCDMAKWTAELDLAHQIGLSTCLRDVLIVDGGLSRSESKNAEIRADLSHGATTSCDMAKRTVQADSAHQIGPSTFLEGVLIVVGGQSSLGYKNAEFRRDLDYSSRTSGRAVKRMAGLDWPGRISLNAARNGVLTAVEAAALRG
jgi:hypothetical protein